MRKRKLLFLLLASSLLTSCSGEDLGLTSESFTSKLIPNWPSFVAQLGALVVLIVVVIVFAYKPIKKILKKRQDHIDENIKEAEKSKLVWKENELKSKETVLASERTAADIVAEAKKTAEKEKAAILETTQLEVNKMKSEAENDIARMEEEAQEQIKKEIVNVALDASKELLGREVSSKDNVRLVEDFIEEVKKN
ncbi:MAG: F0F1 ATP synthase subunit B [Bacilli bacterium]|nr:F0F1 ATP synthase subunit B [Bacilli bacterium]